MCTLEVSLRPFIQSIEKAGVDHDNNAYDNHYFENALVIDDKKKTVLVGRAEVSATFASWKELGKFKIQASNESFSGSADIIRYAARQALEFESGKNMTFDVVQYWRRDGDCYLIEVERYHEI
ncbi:unnamed protein product, partial [Mesorhabditis belari]